MQSRVLTILFILIGLTISLMGYLWLEGRFDSREDLSSEEILGGLSVEEDLPEEDLPPTLPVEAVLWRPILLFGLMLTGIMANTVYERIKYLQSRRNKLTLKNLFKGLGSDHRLWMAVCISPFVFFATYTYVSDLPDNTVAMFYAFQNGFFWEAIFAGFSRK